jgi:putative hydrolase of the HAD superfamily
MTDHQPWLAAVVRHREPLEPLPTAVAPRLDQVDDIRAVIFDIYGTLLISGTGDVGSSDESSDGTAIRDAWSAVGWGGESAPLPSVDQLHDEIRRSNAERAGEACPKPEVDIFEIWRRTLIAANFASFADDTARVVSLAAEYEARTNPTWPMPGARELLKNLASSGVSLGIVSNAQAFTVPLVDDLVGGPLHAHGFDLDLCIFSYRYRQAKPSPRLFDALVAGLRRRGIFPKQTLYVGNDKLNDIWAAAQAGIRTAWFAGDRRSCRPRADDARCASLVPDLVLTELPQLPSCLGIQ